MFFPAGRPQTWRRACGRLAPARQDAGRMRITWLASSASLASCSVYEHLPGWSARATWRGPRCLSRVPLGSDRHTRSSSCLLSCRPRLCFT
eukprot:6258308-Pyramimonas_sp.AAC.1